MLTDQERRLVRDLFAGGPAVLLDEGLSIDQITEFLSREDVAAELRLLETEFNHRDTLEARTRFMTRRALGRLGPAAAAVLGRALAGHVYARGSDGNILRDSKGNLVVRDAGPDGIQVASARAIMDKLGVDDPRLVTHPGGGGSSTDIETVIRDQLADEEKVKVVLKEDPNLKTEEEKALSRERIRTAIDKLMPKLRERLEDKSGQPQGQSARRRRKAQA